jgi:hypothetical protein
LESIPELLQSLKIPSQDNLIPCPCRPCKSCSAEILK